MIAQYIFGGLIILVALLLFIVGIYVVFYQDEINGFLPILLGIIFILAGITVITAKDDPTKQDVFDGKAIYQETQVITGNDTIKTYDIVWKNLKSK